MARIPRLMRRRPRSGRRYRMARGPKNAEGGEENFDEAVSAVLKTVTPPSLPSGAKEVFEYNHIDPVRTATAACRSREYDDTA